MLYNRLDPYLLPSALCAYMPGERAGNRELPWQNRTKSFPFCIDGWIFDNLIQYNVLDPISFTISFSLLLNRLIFSCCLSLINILRP